MKVVMHNKAILVEVERPKEGQPMNMFGKVVARGVHRQGIYEGTLILFKQASGVDERLLTSTDPNMMYVTVEYTDITASIEEEPSDLKQLAEEIVQENTEHELVN